jgi:hypothetical protein
LILFIPLQKRKEMKGINYLTNDKGLKTAVVIDLKIHREEVEDFLDALEAKSRKNEAKEEASLVFERILNQKMKNGEV